MIKNGSLVGNPNFTSYSTSLCGMWDTSATSVTFSDNAQLLFTFQLGDTGNDDYDFGTNEFNAEELTLQPGEWVTLAAKASTGTPSYVNGSLNVREDQ